MKNNRFIALILGLIFFFLGVVTLPHYGINWDTINHLPRGQVYLHYFLTGHKDYSDLPPFFLDWQKKGEWYWQKDNLIFFEPDIPKNNIPRISLYQRAGVDFNYFMEKDGGHPPLSDIISSFFNFVLFQKLGIINDVDSYRIYGILLAASLVGLIFYWVSGIYGKLAGIISALSLSLYPFFWSESHFNTEKDIPETVYLSFFLYSIWQAVRKRSWKWILISGFFFGMALGTKFNILFVGFIIVPWLLIYGRKLFKVKYVFSAIGAILISLSIFIGSWPYLWADPITRIQKVFKFYSGIGLSESNINFYAPSWILYATPLVILMFFVFGLVKIIKLVPKEKYSLSLLAVLWFLVPIVRVTWPGSVIYGGIRQIMEYIPAMAIIAGIGACSLQKLFSGKSKIIATFLLLFFIPITVKMIQIHPNENVYFNPIIGGLKGAKEKNFPFWGNSFGAAYRQGSNWLNANAEEGANIVYAYELIPNIPRIWLRTDLNLNNKNRSGYLQKGEYAITLPYQGTESRSYYDMYLRQFLIPVYEAKVDGVPVVTIWKNEEKYLKENNIEKIDYDVKLVRNKDGLLFDIGEERRIYLLKINYKQIACKDLEHGYVRISKDGNNWQGLPGSLPEDWLIPFIGQQPMSGSFIYPFVGQSARYINVVLSPENTCLKNIKNYQLYYISN